MVNNFNIKKYKVNVSNKMRLRKQNVSLKKEFQRKFLVHVYIHAKSTVYIVYPNCTTRSDNIKNVTEHFNYTCTCLKVKTSFGNAPISKNEMEALYYQSCERICFD